jgi:hypothetical protein
MRVLEPMEQFNLPSTAIGKRPIITRALKHYYYQFILSSSIR